MLKIKKNFIGLIAGLLCGMFASGGGLLLIPAFTYLLQMDEKKARGTAVFCVLPMVITSSFFYYKSNFIDWKISILCAIGGTIGGITGTKLLKKMPTNYLRIFFIIFLFYVSIRMFL